MSFEKMLNGALDQVYGARGVVFLAKDGEIVYQCGQRDVKNLDLLAAYHGITVATCQRFANDVNIGDIRTLVCRYEAGTCVIQTLNEGYFLMFALEADGNIGHAAWVLKQLAPKINEEIGF